MPVIDNGAYEFYRLVRDRIMLVMIPVGLSEFSSKDVERVFCPSPTEGKVKVARLTDAHPVFRDRWISRVGGVSGKIMTPVG